ncbi:hypothetical protein CEXT_511441, partial [Caerostris extrusa]
QGEAIYTIGVSDAGKLIGLDDKEMQESRSTLYRMAEKLGADITNLGERNVDGNSNQFKKTVAEFLVRKIPDDQPSVELRIAVLGNSDVGKSTLLESSLKVKEIMGMEVLDLIYFVICMKYKVEEQVA